MSLHIPSPSASVYFVSGLEFFGGILLIMSLGSSLVGLLLAVNMFGACWFDAYWTSDHDALVSFFSTPGKLYVADPYTFLFASLMLLIFGAGLHSVDTLAELPFESKIVQA